MSVSLLGRIYILLVFFGLCTCVDIQFTSPDNGGFFLRLEDDHQPAQQPDGGRGENGAKTREVQTETTKFTLLESRQPVTIRASYGPFVSQQTIAPSFLNTTSWTNQTLTSGSKKSKILNKPLIIDFSAHLVNKEVKKEQPILRVIFSGKYRRKSVCAVLNAQLNGTNVKSFTVQKGEEDNFLGELTIPSSWWPPLNTKAGKQPKLLVTVSYWILKDCSGEQVFLVPPQDVGEVPLTTGQAGYRQIAGDEILHLLIPQSPVYPGSKLYVPVFLEQARRTEQQTTSRINVLVVRANARKGSRILGVEESSKNWGIRVDLNPRGNLATVTAFRKDTNSLDITNDEGPEEVFNFLYAIDNTGEQVWKGCKMSWHVKYQLQENGKGSSYTRGPRLRHHLHVHKDDVQAVIPISKSLELVNTAVLTGRQVSHPLKVLMVSQAGDIADVTLHTSCTTNDDSALKVSSSCTSVYLDGSETRGALAAQVQVKYGTYSGTANLRVWMPEIPVHLDIPDPQLGIVDGWRVPERVFHKRSAAGGKLKTQGRFDDQLVETTKEEFMREELLEQVDNSRDKVEGSGGMEDKFIMQEEIISQEYLDAEKQEEHKKKEGGCNNRFQQTNIRVFARFTAEDPDSGRREYFVSRSAEVDLTALTAKSIRVLDSRVVSLHGTILRGASVGRTEVQVISPVTGRVIGASEIRVLRTKDQITGIKVNLITGINLSVDPDVHPAVYNTQAEISNQLMAKYQEGLLDVSIEFSDGTVTPLRDVDEEEYYLAVESKDSDIVAFAPAVGSTDPRVIAVGEGEGYLLTVSLELADQCHNKIQAPLAISPVSLMVQTSGSPTSGWKDDRKKERRRKKDKKNGNNNSNSKHSIKSVDMGDISEILSNIALRDDNSHGIDPTLHQSHHDPAFHDMYAHEATTLEVGMYILLGVFCVAITVFMASCFVYASKHQQQPRYPLQERSRSVQNAHDWVWLGRHTLDQSSIGTSASKDLMDNSIRSRESGGFGRGQRLPQRQINIIPNPCLDFSYASRNRVGTAAFDHPAAAQGFDPHALGLKGSPLEASHRFGDQSPANFRYSDQSPPNFRFGVSPGAGLPRFPIPLGMRMSPASYERQMNVSPQSRAAAATATTAASAAQSAAAAHAAAAANNPDLYAELPRSRRSPKPKKERSGRRHQQQPAETTAGSIPQQLVSSNRSTFQQSSHTYPDQQLTMSPIDECQSQQQLTAMHRQQQLDSPAGSHHSHASGSSGSSAPSSKPSINSATYTRQKPVQPNQGDVLPVGFPVFPSSPGHQGRTSEVIWEEEVNHQPWMEAGDGGQGFQNPWEALHSLAGDQGPQGSFYFQEDGPHNLILDLKDEPPPYHMINKQSPASGLPPEEPHLDTALADDDIFPRRGEYIPLNPDINKATPPRFGSLKRVKDPFKVSMAESPPVPPTKLSPSHVFEPSSYLDSVAMAAAVAEEEPVEENSDNSAAEMTTAEDGSSVCSADSAEFGQIDNLLHPPPPPPEDDDDDDDLYNCSYSQEASPYGTYSRVNKPPKAATTVTSSSTAWQDVGMVPTDLDNIAIGSLDYEQLMNYFEGLRESAA